MTFTIPRCHIERIGNEIKITSLDLLSKEVLEDFINQAKKEFGADNWKTVECTITQGQQVITFKLGQIADFNYEILEPIKSLTPS